MEFNFEDLRAKVLEAQAATRERRSAELSEQRLRSRGSKVMESLLYQIVHLIYRDPYQPDVLRLDQRSDMWLPPAVYLDVPRHFAIVLGSGFDDQRGGFLEISEPGKPDRWQVFISGLEDLKISPPQQILEALHQILHAPAPG